MTMRDLDIKQGLHLLREGKIWIAIGPDFVDIKESPIGFGGSPEDAVADWKVRWSAHPDSLGIHAPKLSDFQVHETNDNKDVAAGMVAGSRVLQ